MPSRERYERPEGAGEVLRELLLRERGGFIRLAASLVDGYPIDPEDVVQAACISFLTSYAPGAEHDSPGGYFAAAVKTSAWKMLRTRGRKQRLDYSLADDPDAFEIAGDDEVLADEPALVRGWLVALPERERELVARRLLGFTPAECAEAIGVSSRSYRKLICSANDRLRSSLSD